MSDSSTDYVGYAGAPGTLLKLHGESNGIEVEISENTEDEDSWGTNFVDRSQSLIAANFNVSGRYNGRDVYAFNELKGTDDAPHCVVWNVTDGWGLSGGVSTPGHDPDPQDWDAIQVMDMDLPVRDFIYENRTLDSGTIQTGGAAITLPAARSTVSAAYLVITGGTDTGGGTISLGAGSTPASTPMTPGITRFEWAAPLSTLTAVTPSAAPSEAITFSLLTLERIVL